MNKITLEKKGESKVVLTKQAKGKIVINLNWNQNPGQEKDAPVTKEKKGLFGKLMSGVKKLMAAGPIDLDLGAFVELWSGHRYIIDPLQSGFSDPPRFGHKCGVFAQEPFVFHTGDDRSGDSAEGEFLEVNMDRMSEIRRIIVYAFIYEGVARWKETDAVVTVQVPDQPTIEVRLGSTDVREKFVAIACLDFWEGREIKATKLVTFHDEGHSGCDAHYNWGFRWQAGSK